MFATPSAQRERAQAIYATRALGNSLRRIGEVERDAERQYRSSVTAQLERDQVGVPKLSAEASAVLERVHAAGDQPAVARAWERGRRNAMVAAEIDRFEKAAEQRLGGEGLQHFLAMAVRAGASRCRGSSAARSALRELAHGLAATRRGLLEHYRQRAQEEAEHRQEQRQQARHRGPSLGR